MKILKMAVVGLGQRGYGLIDTLLALDNVDIIAVCDNYEDRVERAVKKIVDKKPHEVAKYTSFDELLLNKDIEAVLIATSWESHINQAIEAMKHGIITAMEVGGAYHVKDCYRLVKAYEKYKTPFMMLENCCYDKFELLSAKLAHDNMLGEIVHAHGAYSHDLREEIASGNIIRHYRLRNYINRNAENYPTHELGPIAKIMGINRGNRMVSMSSIASKSCGLKEYVKSDKCPDKTLVNQEFKQGDIVTTMIKCENGETITLTLDTTLPKFYSREFTIRGTKGSTFAENNLVAIEDKMNMHEFYDGFETMKKNQNNMEEYSDYLPDYWKNITEEQKILGHGGMDYYMLREFVSHALNNDEMPIDVYDAAAWYSITAQSEISIKHNGKVVKIPDFTKGKYKTREKKNVIDLDY